VSGEKATQCIGCETDGAPGWPSGPAGAWWQVLDEGMRYICTTCVHEVVCALISGQPMTNWREYLHDRQRAMWREKADRIQAEADAARAKGGG